jgi:hypothetical protein
MKKILLFCLPLLCTLNGFAQWKTIYEAGFGTSVSLRYDCKSNFTFSADPSSNQNTINFNVTDNQNQIGMSAYLAPFNDQCELRAGIYKFIPEMGQYAYLRIYLELDLPDSVGTVYYSKSPDTTLINPTTGAPLWTNFASDVQSTLIPFSNFEGDKNFYIYSDFKVSPAAVLYKYLRIEADTTQVLKNPEQKTTDFHVFSSGKVLHINPSNPDSNYEVTLFDMSGKCVCREQKTGSQELPMDYSSGIYFAVVEQNHTRYQTKICVE